uniref:Uncharacterized protein n=1 Tax=Cannabis sativa TaxID=3483 RepID=A0A803NSI2_CANSA
MVTWDIEVQEIEDQGEVHPVGPSDAKAEEEGDGIQWLSGTTNKEVSKIVGFIKDYNFVKGMDADHLSFHHIPSNFRPCFTLGLRSRFQKILQLSKSAGTFPSWPLQPIVLRAPNNKKTFKASQVPIERSIKIRDGLEEVARPTVQVTGKWKDVTMEDDGDFFDEDAPSFLVRGCSP